MQMRIALWRAVGYNRAKMSDDFYGDFDRACLPDAFNRERTSDYRSVFHQDRDRVMFTTAFRRLQAKTQVFQAGEYDFYRTRLTHSLEVANIAKSIAVWLRRSEPAAAVDPDLVEAVCLAHDIGHPPFGHAGERVLNALMEDYGGFEGNAQTLRILTRTIFSGSPGRRGMSPTRALLDGVLKYKRLHRDRKGDANHFIYDDQEPILEFCRTSSTAWNARSWIMPTMWPIPASTSWTGRRRGSCRRKKSRRGARTRSWTRHSESISMSCSR
jgi:dGTPase